MSSTTYVLYFQESEVTLKDLLPSDKSDAIVELQAYFKGLQCVIRNLKSQTQNSTKVIVSSFIRWFW